MPSTTSINGLQIPVLSDSANIESAVHPLANAIDSRLVCRFSTVSARDAAIPSPTFGQCASVSGTGEIYFYNGTSWVSAIPRVVRKSANEDRTSTTTLTNDTHLTISVEANSFYIIRYVLFLTSSLDTTDFKFNFSLPGSATRKTGGQMLAQNITTAPTGDLTQENTTTADLIAGGTSTGGTSAYIETVVATGASSGNVVLQWAQQNNSGTAITMQANSFLEARKV